MNFSLIEIGSAFVVMFAIIDPLGSIPIVMGIRQKGIKIHAERVALIAYVLLMAFYFAGDWILQFFGVDLKAFAVAGAVILFLMALEMLLDIEIFKNNGPEGTGSIVPLAFPLFAGPAAFTALLTIGTEYQTINLLLAVTLVMMLVYVVLRCTDLIMRLCGEAGVYILRKFFGLILMAISIKIFVANLHALFTIVS